jgi:molybdate/tungstate transport system permease protein
MGMGFWKFSLFHVAAALLIVMMLGPVVAMLAAVRPGDVIAAFSVPQARDALVVSLIASSAAVAIATLLGVPAGYALAHSSGAVRAIALALLALPLAFPPVASGIMLLQTVGAQTPLGGALASHGITLVDSLPGVALAEFFVAGSFVAIVSTAAFATLDPIYEESARTLGAGAFVVFFRVALPLAGPNVIAGIVLAWMRAIGEYGATSIVAYHPTALPVQLYVTLSAQGVAPALALSYGFVVLAAIAIALQWALRRRVV